MDGRLESMSVGMRVSCSLVFVLCEYPVLWRRHWLKDVVGLCIQHCVALRSSGYGWIDVQL